MYAIRQLEEPEFRIARCDPISYGYTIIDFHTTALIIAGTMSR